MGKLEKHNWGWESWGQTEGEVSGHHEAPSSLSEGFQEEVTFRLRSEVGAGQEMNRRKGASGRKKENWEDPGDGRGRGG